MKNNYKIKSGRLFITLMTMLTMLSFGAFAQTPSFFTGNVNSPSNSFPFGTASPGKGLQSLIAPGEFTGAQFGNITKFYVQGTAGISATYTNLTIKMGQTTATSLPTGAIVTGLTTVFAGTSTSLTSTAAGWMQITLTQPFLYDPTQSLVVEITQCGYTGSSFTVTNVSKTGYRRTYNSSGCTMAYSGQDANLFNCGVDMSSVGTNDIGVTSIDSPATFCSGPQTIKARVKNYGINQVSSLYLNWSVNGTTQTPIYWTGLLDTFNGAGANNTLVTLASNYTFSGQTNLKAWTSLPNGVTDTVKQNDSAFATKGPAFSGVYTINPSGSGSSNFTTFQAAINAMTATGICGPVVFNVAAGTYTQTATLVIPAIAGSSNVNTITFDGGNGNQSTRIVTGALSGASILTTGASYITFKNITFSNTFAGSCQAVGLTGGVKPSFVKCYFTTPNATGSTCYTFATGSYGASSSTVDSLRLDSNTFDGGYYGIYLYGASTSGGAGFGSNRDFKIRYNTVINSYYYGMYLYYIQNGIDLIGNTITNMNGSAGYYGLYMYYCSNHNATNAPHRILNNLFSTMAYNYVYYTSATTSNPTQIYNNMIFNMKNYSTNYGLYVYNGSGFNGEFLIYHNTINTNGSSGTAYGIYYYNSVGGTNTYIKNNILACTSTGAATSYPLYCSTNPTGNIVNYNVYYNASNTNLVYRGSAFTTLNYKSATAGGDSSFSYVPGFVNAATNLHVIDGCQARGVDLTAYAPTDIDGDVRSTTPLIGADEQSSPANDMAVQVLYSPVPPVSATAYPVSVLVKNTGNNAVYSFNIGYRLNNGTPVTQSWSGTLNPCDTTTVTFYTNVTLVINNTLKIYTSLPNGSADANPNNDTLTSSFYSALSGGNYTINPAGSGQYNFVSFQAATSALSNGITGPINITVAAGTYNNGQVIINPIPGASAVNTVTFDGVDQNTRTITGAINSLPLLVFNQCKYVTVKNLKIINTFAGTCQGVSIIGSGANTAPGNTLKNCYVQLPNFGTTTSYCITTTSASTGFGSTTNTVDSLTLDSNTFDGGYYVMYLYGASTTAGSGFGSNRNFKIRYNTIVNAYYYGMYLYYIQNGIDLIGNTITNMSNAAGYYGLYMYYCSNHNATNAPHRILGNKLSTMAYNYIYYTSATTSNPTQIGNNVIFNTKNYSGNYGLYVYNGSGFNGEFQIAHNTIDLSGSTGTAYGIYYYNTVGGTATYIKNNILGVSSSAATGAYPLYCSTNPTGNVVNYNIYYTNSGTYLLYRGSALTSANYKTVTGGGDSSWNKVPSYVNILSNLHLQNGCAERGVDLTSVFNNDIDGDVRLAPPMVGCDEVTGLTNDVALDALTAPTFPIVLGSNMVAARIRNTGTNPVYSFNVGYKLNNGTAVTQSWSGVLNACDTVSVYFTGTQSVNIPSGNNTFKVYTYSPNSTQDSRTSNDTLATVLASPMSGNYVIGAAPSDYTNFTNAVAGLQTRGVAGPVTFTVKSGTYTDIIDLPNNIQGLSAANPVTFRSLVNNADSVIVNSTNSFVARFSGTSYVSLKNLTLNQGTVGNSVIIFTGTPSFDTIYGCKVNAQISSSTAYTITSSGAYLNNVVFRSNIIKGGYFGLYLYNTSAPYVGINCVIDSNTISDQYYYNMYCYYNSVNFKIRANNFIMNNASGTGYVYIYYPDSAYEFSNNNINALTVSSAYTYLSYYGQGNATNHGRIFNNKITMPTATSCSMYIYGPYNSNYQDMYNNDISMGTGYNYWGTGSFNRIYNNTFNSSGSYTHYIYTTNTSTEYKNNVCSNLGGGYCYYFSSASGTENMDYNDLYTTGTTPFYNGGTTYNTLAAWRTATGKDKHSLSYRPAFTAPTTNNLVPNVADSAVWALNARGTYIPTDITTKDRNGVTRAQNPTQGTPDIGAYELTPTSTPPFCTATPSAPAQGVTQVFTFGNDTMASISYDQFATAPSFMGVRAYPGTVPPNIAPATDYTLYYLNTVAPAGFFLYQMNMYYHPEWIGTVPSQTLLKGARKSNPGGWTTYPGYASTVDSVRNILSIPNLSNFGVFAGTNDLNPLPVTLMKFSGHKDGVSASLAWATASEKNSSSFEVERSFDGLTFKSIGKVAAAGNSDVVRNYSYNDLNVFTSGTTAAYYRLRMIDRDGSVAYSNIVLVNDNSIDNTGIKVYPNPFNETLFVELNQDGVQSIELRDISGRLVMSNMMTGVKGINSLDVPSSLQSGIYFLKVGNDVVVKLIKN